MRLGATQSGQAKSSLNLNIRLQRFIDDGRLLLYPGIFLRSGEKLVIYRNGGLHRFKPRSVRNITRPGPPFHGCPLALASPYNRA